jgi:hypothetical protein
MEGYEKTMSGEIKYWNVLSYLCTKKALEAR